MVAACIILLVVSLLFGLNLLVIVHYFDILNGRLEQKSFLLHKRIEILVKRLETEVRSLQDEIASTKSMLQRTEDRMRSKNAMQSSDIAQLYLELEHQRASTVNLKNKIDETTNNILQGTGDQLKFISEKVDNKTYYVLYKLEKEIAIAMQRFKSEIGNMKTDLFNWELKQKVYFSSKVVYKAGFQEDIVFADVTTNIGNAYNNVTGKFTAPYSGVYVCFSNIIAMEIKNCQIKVKINNKFRLYFTVSTEPLREGANMLITHLDQGDRVSIYNNNCDVGFPRDTVEAQWNTFSGFLPQSEDAILAVRYESSMTRKEDMVNVRKTNKSIKRG